jgi:hypothetical protein
MVFKFLSILCSSFLQRKTWATQVDTSLMFAKLIITKNLGQNFYTHLEGLLYMIIPSRKQERLEEWE